MKLELTKEELELFERIVMNGYLKTFDNVVLYNVSVSLKGKLMKFIRSY